MNLTTIRRIESAYFTLLRVLDLEVAATPGDEDVLAARADAGLRWVTWRELRMAAEEPLAESVMTPKESAAKRVHQINRGDFGPTVDESGRVEIGMPNGRKH